MIIVEKQNGWWVVSGEFTERREFKTKGGAIEYAQEIAEVGIACGHVDTHVEVR